ncbi:galactose/methyl galactoside ABC transporter permease MglC [Oceanivirga miroungae]|uniref:Galactoside transport system permease protein MglC n=1 Tax=Oceanivirga miroungae TaxID=1130046 RepID=A0A6I8MCK5_9FUSO|nr:galactose/methyl galactoside ABC transporter permease MglC [Oceanivirga miroungae]VWL84846.1 Galactoside transport system permease protein MglC [Oceanivirga miroungae]
MNNKKIKQMLLDSGIYIVLALLILSIIVKEPTFLALHNLKNILMQSSVRMILALGVAGIIVTQGTDLSAGRQVGLGAVIAGSLLQKTGVTTKVYPNLETLNPLLVILIVVVIGALVGFFNGIIVAKLNVVPFVTTMGTMTIVYGINSLYYEYIGNRPVASFDQSYTDVVGFINLGGIGIPKLIIYALISIVFMWVLWNKTVFGKNLFAVGGNPEAATVSGVNVVTTLVLVYVLSGMMYGVGGFLEAARVGSVTNNMGFMYEMDAIGACVIGGVSFSGGVGKISGVVLGVIIFTVINYGLTYIGVNPYWQYIIKGLIIIFAVTIDMLKYKKGR